MKNTVLLLMFLALGFACTKAGKQSPEPGAPSAQNAPAGGDSELEALRASIKEVEARSEHDATKVKVQHLLVAFKGAPRMQGITRSKQEAEVLTAQLLSRIRAGEDFDALVKQYTDDAHPGIYEMSTATRRNMVPGFGNIGWRLGVGEVGVAAYDARTSPYGWHIIKRLE